MRGLRSSPESVSSTSLTLLQRAKRSDNDAWERIAQLYGPLVYRLCRLSGIRSDDAHDVVQETFRSVFRGISRFRRNEAGDSFRAWMLTITKNKIRDHYRRKLVQPVGGTDMHAQLHQLQDMEWESSVDGGRFDAESNLMSRAVKLVQGDFAEKTWQAFWKTTVEAQDPVEVADQLGISKWSVYQAKSRVLRRIRAELDGLLG